MKKLFILLFVATAFMTGCNQKKSMNGAWKVVDFENISEDKVKLKLNENVTGNEMKIWSNNHFMYVGRYKMDTTSFDSYGSGSYTLDGNHYVENLTDVGDGKREASQVRLLLEIKNDTIIQTWPADENWIVNKSDYFVQKLVRVD